MHRGRKRNRCLCGDYSVEGSNRVWLAKMANGSPMKAQLVQTLKKTVRSGSTCQLQFKGIKLVLSKLQTKSLLIEMLSRDCS